MKHIKLFEQFIKESQKKLSSNELSRLKKFAKELNKDWTKDGGFNPSDISYDSILDGFLFHLEDEPSATVDSILDMDFDQLAYILNLEV